MAMQFKGTFDELVRDLDALNIRGTWSEQPNGVMMLRCASGANVHWSSTRYTLWFSGKPAPRDRLIDTIERAATPPRRASTPTLLLTAR